jgi:hypothetical protein
MDVIAALKNPMYKNGNKILILNMAMVGMSGMFAISIALN